MSNKIPKMTVRLTNKDAVVPNPSTGRRLVFGEEYDVPDAPYWHRRIKDGSVTAVVATPESKKKTATP